MRDLGVVRKSHSVPDKGQEAKMNELEEIQSRTCFNQTFFSPLGLARSFFLDALNFERQAVVGERPLVIQARPRGKEQLSAPSANQRARTAAEEAYVERKGNPSFVTFSPRLGRLSRVCFLSFFCLTPRFFSSQTHLYLLGSAASQKSLVGLSLSLWVASLSFPSPSPPSSPEVSQQ